MLLDVGIGVVACVGVGVVDGAIVFDVVDVGSGVGIGVGVGTCVGTGVGNCHCTKTRDFFEFLKR